MAYTVKKMAFRSLQSKTRDTAWRRIWICWVGKAVLLRSIVGLNLSSSKNKAIPDCQDSVGSRICITWL